ncbi:decapping and exoribonuclease protein-like isoform X2 [Ixodes scapularis]
MDDEVRSIKSYSVEEMQDLGKKHRRPDRQALHPSTLGTGLWPCSAWPCTCPTEPWACPARVVPRLRLPPSRSAAQRQYQWSGRVCLSFLDKLLFFIKDCVTEDDPDVVYFFSYDIKKEKEVTCRRLSKPGKFKFLPASYLENFSK